MSIHISVLVWKHSKQKGNHLLVMLALADQANEDGWSYPAKSTIAKRCRLSKRYTDSIIAELVKSGELVVLHRYEDGRNISNDYKITISHPDLGDSLPLIHRSAPPRSGRQSPPDPQISTPLIHRSAKSSLETSFNREGEPSGANAQEHPDPLDVLFSQNNKNRKDKK